MDSSFLNLKSELLEALDIDLPEEETNEQVHSKLMLVDKTDRPGENLSSSTIQASDKECKHIELQEEREEELYFSSQNGSYSSLDIYMKTLSRFSPLNKEEEISLAKQIRKREKECKNLVIKWRRLFRKEYLKKLPPRKLKRLLKNSSSLMALSTFLIIL